jgi:hypothetical protein
MNSPQLKCIIASLVAFTGCLTGEGAAFGDAAYAKGLEGRIDDADGGWKGRGLWITSGDRTPWHKEGGKGMKPLVVHFQVRTSPLAD